MASFYTNENYPVEIARYLRKMGHDVLTSYEAGKANQRIPDNEVLGFASQSGRSMLTLNRRDFIAIHEKTAEHAGIIVCTHNPNAREQAEQIDALVQEMGNLAGKLIRANRKG